MDRPDDNVGPSDYVSAKFENKVKKVNARIEDLSGGQRQRVFIARFLAQMMVGSSLPGAVFAVVGLWLFYRYDLTSGATIIMVCGVVFFISLQIERSG